MDHWHGYQRQTDGSVLHHVSRECTTFCHTTQTLIKSSKRDCLKFLGYLSVILRRAKALRLSFGSFKYILQHVFGLFKVKAHHQLTRSLYYLTNVTNICPQHSALAQHGLTYGIGHPLTPTHLNIGFGSDLSSPTQLVLRHFTFYYQIWRVNHFREVFGENDPLHRSRTNSYCGSAFAISANLSRPLILIRCKFFKDGNRTNCFRFGSIAKPFLSHRSQTPTLSLVVVRRGDLCLEYFLPADRQPVRIKSAWLYT